MADGFAANVGGAAELWAPPERPTARSRWRRRGAMRALGCLAVAAGALLAWGLASLPLFRSLELKTYDWRMVLGGKQTPPPDIVLVTIDARTEAALPEPRALWHPHFAELLRAAEAGGARLVGVDVVFPISAEKWVPDGDRELAAAFAEVSVTVPVILAYANLQPAQAGLPLYMLASAQDAIGYANLTKDMDGYARRQELTDRSGSLSFVARLAEHCRPDQPRIRSENGKLLYGGASVPLDPAGFMMIRYWGPGGTFPAVSMADVLAAARQRDSDQLARWFKGRIVLVGSLDPSDSFPTPFYASDLQGRWDTPGVEIHANTLETLLEARFLREASPAICFILIAGFACVTGLAVFRIRFPLAPLALFVSLAAYLAIAVLFEKSGLVVPVVAPLLAMVLSGLGSYGVYTLTEGRQRRLLQDMFGRYVSSEVAKELLEYGNIPLGGTRRQITVLFSDLRDYTGYCQSRDPRQVVGELNEHFADMTALIKANGGMVNKFLGDGIMALFGAPLPAPNHALAAVRCAIEMVRHNDECNRGRAERGLRALVVGIGIHSGEAVVGTIGAPERMEYTAIGSTVNVASRIEGQNKEFHTRVLVSEATYRLIQNEVAADLAGLAKLKGIDDPLPLYKILEAAPASGAEAATRH